jgi:hypothetical protein
MRTCRSQEMTAPAPKLRPRMHGFMAHDHNHAILAIPCFRSSSKRLQACHRKCQEAAHMYVRAATLSDRQCIDQGWPWPWVSKGSMSHWVRYSGTMVYVRLQADTTCSAYSFRIEGRFSRDSSARSQACSSEATSVLLFHGFKYELSH